MGATGSSNAVDVPHTYLDGREKSADLTPAEERALAEIVQAGRSSAAALRFAVVPLGDLRAFPVHDQLARISGRAQSYLRRASTQWVGRGGDPGVLAACLNALGAELAVNGEAALSGRALVVSASQPAAMLVGALALDREITGPAHSRPAAVALNAELTKQAGRLYEAFPPTTLEVLDVAAAVRAARDLFIRSFLHLAVARARAVRRCSRLDFEDLVQSGSEGLIHAANNFDPRFNVPFGAYAYMWVKRMISRAERHGHVIALPEKLQDVRTKIRRACTEAQTEGRSPDAGSIASVLGVEEPLVAAVMRADTAAISLEAAPGQALAETRADDESPAPEEHARVRQRREAVAQALAASPARERCVIASYFGIGCEPRSVPKIARSLGVSSQRCYKLKDAGLRRLRRPTVAHQLVDHL